MENINVCNTCVYATILVTDEILCSKYGIMNSCEACKHYIEDLTKKQGENTLFTVTPKEIDKLTMQMANIISSAINITFHNISVNEIDSYIS